MEHSDSIKTFAGAFVKAQSKIAGAIKDTDNPFFKKPYADLSSVMIACKGALNANGISVIQAPAKSDGARLLLETILIHESGEWIKGVCDIPMIKQDPQAFGSALTYARRYGLMSMVGVCPEDDDANGASNPPLNGNTQQRPQSRPAPKSHERRTVPAEQSDSNSSDPAEQEQLAIQMGELLSVVQMPKDWEATCLKKAGAKTWYEVPADKLKACIAVVKAKQAKGKEVPSNA